MKLFYKLFLVCLLIFLYNGLGLYSQGTAGEKADFETRYIVDMPNAGVIPKGYYSCSVFAFHEGSMMLEFSVSPFTDFMLGLSYGGTNIIGSGNPSFQNLPGILLKYRIIDETKNAPAIAVGFNSQGRGVYESDSRRYENMSPGLYAALSKNYKWALGMISVHLGVNYSFEQPASQRKMNFYCGLEQSIGNIFSFNFEFNSNFNDGNEKITNEMATISAALRCSLGHGLTVEMQARDLLHDYKTTKGFSRTFAFEFISPI